MMRKIVRNAFVCAIGLTISAACSEQPTQPFPDTGLRIASQGNFYAGGAYAGEPPDMRRFGQMYVQFQVPAGETKPYPIVFVHGGSRTGADWWTTPDNRPGWAEFFLRRGYPVYVVDQVARGRSPFVDTVYGAARYQTYEFVMQRFAASEQHDLWPQSRLHTQWPGTAEPGDPAFDNYYAGGISSMEDRVMQTRMNIEALAALLDRIGPSIVVVHSQSGAYGWPLVQARPGSVKALVALEPSGPPAYDVEFLGPPDYFVDSGELKPWGIGIVPIAYEPAVSDPSELSFAREETTDSPDHARCWLQAEPARELAHFENTPILVMEAESSFYAAFNHCTVKYLEQAGVTPHYIRLQDTGISGNGHMMMSEKNSDAVAQIVAGWLDETLGP